MGKIPVGRLVTAVTYYNLPRLPADTGETRLLVEPEFAPLALAGDGDRLLAYSSRAGTGQIGRACTVRLDT